ncbi:MAG TPA: hypothetical protein VF140_05205 [Phycicoccus sp.]
MVVLGVVLVLLAFGVGALLVAGTASLDGTVDVSVPGGTLSLPPLTFLVLGMVVITVFWLGWAILRGGVRRSRRRRHEVKEAEARRVAEEKRLKEELAARERALEERDKAAQAGRTTGGSAASGGAGAVAATPEADRDTTSIAPGEGADTSRGQHHAPSDATAPTKTTAPTDTTDAADPAASTDTAARTDTGAATRGEPADPAARRREPGDPTA